MWWPVPRSSPASSTRRAPAPPRAGGASGWAALAVCVLGTFASAYLTYEHFSRSTSLACPESKRINCTKVTTSAWSHVAGVPVALLGLLFFLAMLALCVPALWRERRLDVLRVAAVGAGMLFVLYLIWAELYRIEAICLWCTFVHVCTLALLGIVTWRWIAEPV